MELSCIDPWEVHCVECGEPDCYRTCVKYRPSRTGRCGRVVGWRARGVVEFREWGKLELLWHGRMADAWAAAVARLANGLFEPLALLLGPCVYRVFRSVRWRVGKALARHRVQPTVWRVAVESAKEERLRLELRDRDLRVRGDWTVVSGAAGRRGGIEIALPEMEDGALLSVYPEGAIASGKIRFIKNELVAAVSKPAQRPTLAKPTQPPLKCIAWDLDGVIWDGTLSEGDAVKVRPGVLETIRALDEVGIVSSICSKNDAEVALAKLKELGIEEWFVFPQINWGPKSASIWQLAKEMNIGLDAIGFVDDRAENRAEVKVNCPGVRVWDERMEGLKGSAIAGKTGGLGSKRRLMYREEMARRGAARRFAGDAVAFAEASNLRFELLPVEGERIARCRELVQRTNQLNLTARRYDEAAFAALLSGCETHAVRVRDNYGDYGIVGFLALRGTHLVECCFSCRAAGRGIERKVLARIAAEGKLTADIVETERNAPIREIVKEFL